MQLRLILEVNLLITGVITTYNSPVEPSARFLININVSLFCLKIAQEFLFSG